jgi:proteic killer suppression protein
MIKTFADRETERVYIEGKSRRLPQEVLARAKRRLDRLNAVTAVEQLRQPPGNRLHLLTGDRQGQWSASINMQWRMCFRVEKGNALDVEIYDYH